MRLSVIVPVYRVEHTLDRCLKSIVCQNHDDMEVILVDDGSPDRCPQLCDEWAQRDSRIRVVHRKNGGLSAARNTGIDMAQGDYLTFVDSDDFIGLETYRQLMERLTERPDIDLLEYPIYWHYGAKDQKIIDFNEQEYTDISAYWLQGRAYEHSYAWNKIYRRELFQDVRFPEGEVFEDMATLPRLLQHARCIVTGQQGLYHYCWNEQGITATAGADELEQLLDNHLNIITDRRLLDERYYMHIVNIQMDIYELTGKEPQLPSLSVSPLAQGLSLNKRLKAAALNLLGIERLCRTNKTIHRLLRRQS